VADADLSRVFEPGQYIVIGQGGSYPSAAVEAMNARPERLRDSTIFVGIAGRPLPSLACREIVSFFPAGELGRMRAAGTGNVLYWRASLFQVATAFASRARPVDVAVARVSPARDGAYSLAFNSDYILSAVQSAARLVLEICPDAPWVGEHIKAGDPRIGAILGGPPGLAKAAASSGAADALAQQLLAHVGPYVRKAEAIQVGLGSWTSAVARMLPGTGIRVHSGFVDSWLVQALSADPSSVSTVTTTGFAGTAEVSALVQKLVEQGRFRLVPATELHAPATLGSLRGLVAINSVWEVDRLGRGNSENLRVPGAPVQQGGIGGLPDFARAASLQADGLSVLCLRSTDAAGRPRLVGELAPDQVSLDSTDVDMVVTEHGGALLRGVAVEQRPERLMRLGGQGADKKSD
jgi:acyl-CoA hydrolase